MNEKSPADAIVGDDELESAQGGAAGSCLTPQDGSFPVDGEISEPGREHGDQGHAV